MMNINKPLIPNGQLETMFMRICTDDQMAKYVSLVNKGKVASATAYVSRLVTRKFFEMVEKTEGVK